MGRYPRRILAGVRRALLVERERVNAICRIGQHVLLSRILRRQHKVSTYRYKGWESAYPRSQQWSKERKLGRRYKHK